MAYGEVYYCIQLASSSELARLKEIYRRISGERYARIEKIGGIYTLRVGRFEDLESAKKVLLRLKRFQVFKGAFVRKCKHDPDRVVYGDTGLSKEELFKLLMTALLGSQKLEEALKVARRGTELFPDSPYWWKVYAELLEWTGNSARALRPYIRAYELSGNREFLRKAFNIAISYGRYDVAKDLMGKLDIPYEQRLVILRESGDVSGLIKFLKKDGSENSLKTLARILFTLGRTEEALAVVERIEKTYGPDKDTVLLKAKILYAEKRYKKALETLKRVMSDVDAEDKEFWETLAMLSWILGDYDTSVKASLVVIESGQADITDYDRAALILSRKKPEKSVELSLEAWRKFKARSFIFRALDIAYLHGLWGKIVSIVEKEDRTVLDEEFAFIYYTTALYRLGKVELAVKLLDERLRNRFSLSLLSHYIYVLIEVGDVRRLERVIRTYRRYKGRPEVAEAFVNAYLYLHRGWDAYTLYKKARIKNTVLLANILDILGEKEHAHMLRHKEFKKLNSELGKNPRLLYNPEFSAKYMYLALYFLRKPFYEKLLFQLRGRVPEALWRDMYLSYLFSREDYPGKIRRLVAFKKYPLRPWMELSLYLRENDTYGMREVATTRWMALPPSDSSEAFLRSGNTRMAALSAYSGLERNPYNLDIYTRLREVYLNVADSISLGTRYLSRKGYSEVRTSLKTGFKGVFKGLDLKFGYESMFPVSSDEDVVAKTPGGHTYGISLGRRFGRAGVELGVNRISRVHSAVGYRLSAEFKPLSEFTFGIDLNRNSETEETLYLYLGGLKDAVNLYTYVSLTARVSLYGSLEFNRFYSYSRDNLGEGRVATFDITYKLKGAYPDFTLSLYTQAADFSSSTYTGDLDGVAPSPGYQLIPESYESVGGRFSFGYEHKDSYVRVWRPFFSAETGYNTRYGLLSSVSFGLGGSVFSGDNLSLEASVSNNVGATQETISVVNVLYRRWF